MTKQEQIEKLMLDIPQTIVAYDANPKGQHLYGEQRLQIAEVLYDKGYRNVSEYKAERELLGSQIKVLKQRLNNKYIEVDNLNRDYHNSFERLKAQERELMQLKAENARLTGRLGQVLLTIDTVKEMNAMCDIDDQRKQAVKEFAGKIKAKLNVIFGKTICSDLDTEDITDIIDEFIKEIEKQ